MKWDYLSLDKIIMKYPGIMVVILAETASKDIISKAFMMQCAAIVDKQYFQLFAEFVLESITTFRGFCLSPLFVKYLIKENPISPVSSTVFLSKKQTISCVFLNKDIPILKLQMR